MAALLIVVNLSFINTSAAMAAPVIAGEEFAAFLTELLLGAGHSQSEIDGMSIYDMQNTVKKDIETNIINIDTRVPSYKGPYIPDPNGIAIMGGAALLDWLANDPNNVLGRQIISNALNDFIGNGVSDDDIYNYFTPTSTTDYMGHGALCTSLVNSNYSYATACDYILVEFSEDGNTAYLTFYNKDGSLTDNIHTQNGSSTISEGFRSGTRISVSYVDGEFIEANGNHMKLSGDVRYLDGTDFPTDEEYEYKLGEADGTKVTLDMLNPDGTVTIDGVTYYPVDYLNPDNLTDEGKQQIINNITNVINNTYVVADDKPIVDADDITVEVAEELQDYAVPVGIANVFPFCIPWDIVRGFQLLNRPAVTPKFEIPFNIPEFGLFPGVDNSITLDFSKYDTYIQIFRWFQLIGFSFLLCKLSLTRVKGAGA